MSISRGIRVYVETKLLEPVIIGVLGMLVDFTLLLGF